MAEQAGIFIALEGTDGSGKTTHFELLADKLRTAGYDVATFDFPQYDQPSTYFVKRYLSGAYGTADQVGPYTASLFYSLDRYEAAPLIRQALSEGNIVISNRFTGSNMAHQGTKFKHAEERRGFFIWADNLEYQMLGIPRPDINIVLRVPADIASKLASQNQPSYLGGNIDIHESDMSHLERSVEVYDDLCNLFPKDFSRIDCVRGGNLLPIEAVHKLVWEKLSPLLPRPPRRKSAKQTAQPASDAADLQNRYLQHLPSGTIVTNAGYDALSGALTGEDGIAIFTDELSQSVIAEVLASLPTSDRELGIAILEQLGDTSSDKPDASSVKPSSKEFLTTRFTLAEASQRLLAEMHAAGHGVSMSEQLLSSTDYASRDKHGRFRYYVPPEFDSQTTSTYCDAMDKIFEIYGRMLETLGQSSEKNAPESAKAARQTASSVLPVATTSTAGYMMSGAALENLIVGLEGSLSSESRATANLLLEEAGKLLPSLREDLSQIFSQSDYSAKEESATKLKTVASRMIAANYGLEASNAVTLTDIWPRNELDLVPNMLYVQVGKPLDVIREQAEAWTYDQKFRAFEAYFRDSPTSRPHSVLQSVRYGWDVVCEMGKVRELQRLLPAGSITWQTLTPRYGFDISGEIEDAGLSDDVEECFDISLRLHSQLQQAGYEEQSQYAVLLGHKVRASISLSGSEAAELIASDSNTKLAQFMSEKIAERHPLLAELYSR